MKTKFKILATLILTFALVLSVVLIGSAEEPSETKLDNEFYHSYTSTSADVGSISGRWNGVVGSNGGGTINNNVELYDGSSFLKIEGTGLVRTNSNYFQYLMDTPYKFTESTNANYVILEYDIATEGKIANDLYYSFRSVNANGGNVEGEKTKLTQSGEEITVSAGNFSFKISGAPHTWTHITMIVEITDTTKANSTSSPIHYYANGVYQGTLETATPIGGSGAVSLTGIRMYQGMSSKVMNEDETLLLDNISMTLYSKVSDGEGSLAYVLADKENRNLSEWTAGTWTEDYAFPPSGTVCAIGETPYGSFEEAYDAVQDGEVIEIYQHVTEPFEVTKPIKVDTNGYTFNYFSNTLILKEVNGTEFTFGEGQITVSFYDEKGNLLASEVYTSAREVSVPEEVTEALPEYITYVENEDGSASVKITDGWKKSTTEGAPSYGADELGYATPANNNFYLNSYVITSSIVVIDDNDGVHEVAEGNLAAAVNAITTESATVILNEDITLPSSVVITKDVTVDFNTHSITYDGIHTMFVVRAGSLDLEGPGSINKTSKASYVFDVEDGANSEVKINGVDITSTTVVANVQSGSLSVSNSTIKVEGAEAVDAIVVKNADVSVSDSTIELEASGEESYAIKAEGANVTLTGSTLTSNAGGLATDTDSTASLEEGTTVKAETAFGGETANVTLTEGVQISTNNGTENVPIPDGLVFAYTEDVDVPYVLTSDYVEVTWKVGTTSVTECWVKGSKPMYKDASVGEALDALQLTNADKTKRYAFIIERAYENTTFEPALVNIIAPMYNLELDVDIDMNIYVPTEQYGATTASIVIGGETLDVTKLETVTIGLNDYYVVTVEGILASKACDTIEYKVNFKVADTDYSLTFNTSVVKYCAAVLEKGTEEHSEETLTMVKALLNYIDKTYKYVGTDTDAAYAELAAIMTEYAIQFTAPEYSDSVTDLVIEEDNDRVGAADRFTNVAFVCDKNGPRYEFTIAEGFSGRIKIMQGDDVTVYNVTWGKLDGSSVIVYQPEIDQLLDVITVNYNDNRTIFVYDVTSFLANESNDAKAQAYADALVVWCTLVSEAPVIE